MFKIQQITILLLFSLLFSACFELREEIDLNKDGSGTYRLLLDMSQSKQTIDLAQKMQQEKEGENTQNLHFTIDSTFAKSVARFNGMAGISQAKDTVNKVDYIFGVSFRFSGIEALNNAIAELNKDENGKTTIEKPIYSLNKNVFERQNDYYFNNISEVLKSKPNQMQTEKAEQIKLLLQGANYIIVTKVNGKIKKYNNKKAEIDYTKTVLRLSTPLQEAMEGRGELANAIKIK
jgi:hypothetical protein